MTPLTLTAKQVEYLRACAEGPTSLWHATPQTRKALNRLRFIEQDRAWKNTTMYIATDAGRAWLAANGGNDGRE